MRCLWFFYPLLKPFTHTGLPHPEQFVTVLSALGMQCVCGDVPGILAYFWKETDLEDKEGVIGGTVRNRGEWCTERRKEKQIFIKKK